MIGGLLKQLVIALGLYIRHHVRRVLGLKNPVLLAANGSNNEAKSNSASPAGFDALSDRVGLDSSLLEPISWPTYRDDTPPAELEIDPLYQVWRTMSGGHKWSQYFPIYREVFGPLAKNPNRILEIGVFHGASLELWKRYFSHPDTLVVGIDIDPNCAQFDAPNERKHVRIGSQTDAEFLRTVISEFGPFDLIIDDGSHISSHVIETFNHLFATGLKDTGIYFVEDLHAVYWPGWRDSRKTFFDVCAELVEHMHAHYRIPQAAINFFNSSPSDNRLRSIEVPKITTMIKEIRFFDSIVAIYKVRQPFVPYYLRMDG